MSEGMDSSEFDGIYNRIEKKVDTSNQSELQKFFSTFKAAVPVSSGGDFTRTGTYKNPRPGQPTTYTRSYKYVERQRDLTGKQQQMITMIIEEASFRDNPPSEIKTSQYRDKLLSTLKSERSKSQVEQIYLRSTGKSTSLYRNRLKEATSVSEVDQILNEASGVLEGKNKQSIQEAADYMRKELEQQNK